MTRPLLLCCVLLLMSATGCSPSGGDPVALMQTAQQHEANGEHAAAIIAWRNFLAIEPQSLEARTRLARSHLENGEPVAAEDELRKAIDRGADPRNVAVTLGRALLLQGKHERLLEEIPSAADATAHDAVQIDVLRGLANLALGRMDDAQVLLDRANRADPANAESLLGLAALAAAADRGDEALQLIDRAIAAEPRNAEAWVVRGDFHRLHDRSTEAIADYRHALELAPNNLNANVQLAALYAEQERFDEARSHLEYARTRLPDSPFVTYLHALVEFRNRNPQQALRALEQSLRKHPGHLPSLLLAGTIQHSVGDEAKAIESLRTVLERAPGSRAARRMLATAMLQSGQVQRSIQLLEEGLAESPEDPDLLATLAQAHLANDDMRRALPLLERAARMQPKSVHAQTRLQIARLLGGQTGAVLADLEAGMTREHASPAAELLYVVTLLQARQFDRALRALAPLEKSARTPLGLNLEAAALVGLGKPEAARRALENALALNPRFTTALVNLARLDLQEQGPHAARKRLESHLQRYPRNARVLTVLAQMGPELGASDELILEWLERARAANPGSVSQLLLLARAYLRTGDAAKAMQVIGQAQEIDPDQAAVLEALGEAQLALGHTSAALGTYSVLALQNPRSVGVLYRLASAQEAAGNTAGAGLTLRRALEVEPTFAPALARLGALELKVGRAEQALSIAQELKHSHPALPDGFALEGDVHLARKAFDEAALAYFAAHAQGDNRAELAIKLHMALQAAGRGKEAERFLADFEKAHPAEVAVHAYLGDAHLAAERHGAAMERYARVLAAQPRNALVLNNMAWAAYRLGDRSALEHAQKAHELRPDDPIVLDTLGWLLVEDGEIERGITLLQRAVTLEPENPELRYHLVQALLKQRNPGAARRELERLLTGKTRFAQEAEARALLERLR